MNQELDVRKIFLEDFTKRLILTIIERKRIMKSLDIKNKITIKLPEIIYKEDKKIPETILPVISSQNFNKQIQRPNPIIFQPTRPLPFINKENIPKILANSISNPIPAHSSNTLIDISQNQDSMKKIYPFISDPQVQSVECKGPGKPILVLKRGIIQVTNIILSNEEIEALIKNISDKTRIPLMKGLFKALFGNLIITAVISEFVGTRFIIEKRMN